MKKQRYFNWTGWFGVILLASSVWCQDVSLDRIQTDVEYLCQPALRGRELPGVGGERAAEWLVERMTGIGLQPGFSESFTQSVPLQVGYLDTAATTLTIICKGEEKPLRWGEDFYVFPRHAEPIHQGSELRDCSYGIESAELNRHDFLPLDAPNLTALVRQASDLPPEKTGRQGITAFKAAAAKRHSAMLLVVMSPPGETFPPTEVKDKLESAAELKVGLPGEDPEMPVVYVDGSVMKDYLTADSAAGGVFVELKTSFRDRQETSANNVCGIFPGEIDEWVVVGAHYDHLGVKDSTAEEGLIYYPGADDNASGVAGLLEICRLWKQNSLHKRGLIAVAFTAEEDGCLGSRYFAANLPVPKQKIAAVVNLDMIGGVGYASMREAIAKKTAPDPDYASVMYSAASPALKEIIAEAAAANPLITESIAVSGFPYTDAGSFSEIRIPSLHLFSGFNPDYSTINDKPEALNWVKLERMTRLAYELLDKISRREDKLHFDPSIKPEKPGMRY